MKLLRWFEVQIKLRYACDPRYVLNYEDLYFLASQIRDDLANEYDNPAVLPLIKTAYAELLPRMPSSSGSITTQLSRLTQDAISHMRRCVISCLCKEPERLDYLEFIAEAFKARGGKKLDILTLNHDTVLERYLRSREIRFVDGFAENANKVGIRAWKPDCFLKRGNMIRVLKLHGGVDWNQFRPSGAAPSIQQYWGIQTKSYLDTLKDEHGRTHDPCLDPNGDRLPIFLIGTFNKLSSYTDSINLEIYYQAVRSLQDTDVLVTVGYGFGDKGINKLITEWMYRSAHRRLVVIDLHACTVWEKARLAISLKWEDWLKTKRLLLLPFDLKNKLTWGHIDNLLRGSKSSRPKSSSKSKNNRSK